MKCNCYEFLRAQSKSFTDAISISSVLIWLLRAAIHYAATHWKEVSSTRFWFNNMGSLPRLMSPQHFSCEGEAGSWSLLDFVMKGLMFEDFIKLPVPIYPTLILNAVILTDLHPLGHTIKKTCLSIFKH